jgi:hypothetical protein
MAITRYRITLALDFEDATKRDNIYNKIKTALANAKAADAWVSGNLNKDEYTRPDQSTETV